MSITPVFVPPPPLPTPPLRPEQRLERLARRESWRDDSVAWPPEARRLLDEKDVAGLVEYYEAKALARPWDLHVRLRLGEALLRAERPDDALRILGDCHRRAPEYARCRGLIVDALEALGRDLGGYAWSEDPRVLDLDPDLLDRCLGFLRARTRSWAVDDLHRFWSRRADRVRFTPEALLRAFEADERFELDEMCPASGDPSTAWVRPAGTKRERRWFPEDAG